MRLGIFGGTFDPPHIGHLLVASDATEALGLDRLVFVPAARQPLKREREGASGEHRVAMLRLLVGDDRRFEVDPIEIDRAGLSYTVDTLEVFAQRYAGDERFFLVGADAFATFDAWRAPERIVRLARVVILRRPGSAAEAGSAPGETISLTTRLIDVSSTEIRERLKAGRSIRGFVPESVADFIAAEQLYR